MDILSMVLSYAFAYVAYNYDHNISPTVNWTAINATTWWGDGSSSSQDIKVYSANITFNSNIITDLKARLSRNVSYIAPLENAAFTYGFNHNYLSNWTSYWATKYDFTTRLANMNKYPMYKTNIQGLDIFFVRVTPQVTDTSVAKVPLLMLHGFPSSILEYYDAIPYLTAANASGTGNFVPELIIPCLPGYGYSQRTNKTGFGAAQAAVVMRSLMLRLGFTKYYVHGGDLGAIVGSHIATLFPNEVLGYHTHWGRVLSPTAILAQMLGQFFPPLVVRSDLRERMYPLYTVFSNTMEGLAYLHWQATKPDTALVGMEDSPTGFLAYMLDIITRQNDIANIKKADGGLFDHLSQDTIIDMLMMYWAPGSIGSAFRMYAETFNIAQSNLRLDEIPIEVPTWVIQPKHEISYQPPLILRMKYPLLLNATALDFGGHFFPKQYPQVFAKDVLLAIQEFRIWHNLNATGSYQGPYCYDTQELED